MIKQRKFLFTQEGDMQDKPRIALFVDSYFPMVDGVVNVVDNYAKLLGKEFDVMVFAPKSRNKGYVDNVPYKLQRCKAVKIFFLEYDMAMPGLDSSFKKALKEFKPDIVHLHSPFGVGKLAITYGKKHHVPIVATFHSQFKRDFYRATKSKALSAIMLKTVMSVFKKADVVWTLNDFCVNLVREYGYKGRVEIVPNGTNFVIDNDTEYYKKIAEDNFGIKYKQNNLLFIGRLVEEKGVFEIVNALSELKKKNFPFNMIFLGDGTDRKKLEKALEEKGVKENTLITGRILDQEIIKSIIVCSDLFVFPSIYDNSPLVKIEAAAGEVPSICLKNSGAGSSTTDGVNGYLIEKYDELADKIIEALSDRQKLSEIGKNAKEQIYVTWDQIIDIAIEKYKKLIDEFKANNGKRKKTKKSRKLSKKQRG